MGKTLKDKDIGRHSGKKDLGDVKYARRQSRLKKFDEDGNDQPEHDGKIRGWASGQRNIDYRLIRKFFTSRVGKKWDDVRSELFNEIHDQQLRYEALSEVEQIILDTPNGPAYNDRWGHSTLISESFRDILYIDGKGRLAFHPGKKYEHKYHKRVNGFLTRDGLYVQVNECWFVVQLKDVQVSQKKNGKLEGFSKGNNVDLCVYGLLSQIHVPITLETKKMGFSVNQWNRMGPDAAYDVHARRQISSSDLKLLRKKYPELKTFKFEHPDIDLYSW
jgi:hypothetical protein